MNTITIPWPDWKIVRRIGRGGFGTVYEISRKDQFGHEEHSALKVITLPQEEDEIDQLGMDGYAAADIANRYKDQLKKIVEEYTLQVQMKGNSHIVSVEDRKAIPHADGLGWDLYIRMELLTPMREILKSRKDFTEEEIIRIGCDICRALVLCQKKNIIHRDIKPDNIFMSAAGDWKLGDFGIARTMEHSTAASKAGTFSYMAPEVFHGEKYGKEVDIYSLGMILYWLLNNRRRPFLPVDRPPTAAEEEKARIRRFSEGAEFPPPLNGNAELKRIVLKACAYHPKDRYSSAEEMLKDLNALMAGAGSPEHSPEKKINVEADRTVHVLHTGIDNASEGSSQEGWPAINEAGDFNKTAPLLEKPVEGGGNADVSIGEPKKLKGEEKGSADIIEKPEQSDKVDNYSGKQTASGGKKGPGALVISGAAVFLVFLIILCLRGIKSPDSTVSTSEEQAGLAQESDSEEQTGHEQESDSEEQSQAVSGADPMEVRKAWSSFAEAEYKLLQDTAWGYDSSYFMGYDLKSLSAYMNLHGFSITEEGEDAAETEKGFSSLSGRETPFRAVFEDEQRQISFSDDLDNGTREISYSRTDETGTPGTVSEEAGKILSNFLVLDPDTRIQESLAEYGITEDYLSEKTSFFGDYTFKYEPAADDGADTEKTVSTFLMYKNNTVFAGNYKEMTIYWDPVTGVISGFKCVMQVDFEKIEKFAGEQEDLLSQLEAVSIAEGSPMTKEDFIFYNLDDAEYTFLRTWKAFPSENAYASYGGTVRTARGIETNVSSYNQVLQKYGQPDLQGTVTKDSWYYRLEHDFEGKDDEEIRREADSHLDQSFVAYTFDDEDEVWALYFVFDSNDILVLQGVSNKQLF